MIIQSLRELRSSVSTLAEDSVRSTLVSCLYPFSSLFNKKGITLISVTSNAASNDVPVTIDDSSEQDKCSHPIIIEVAKGLQGGSNNPFKEHGIIEDSTLVGVINSDLRLQCILNSDSANAHNLNGNQLSDAKKTKSVHSNLRKENGVMVKEVENNGEKLVDRKQHGNNWGNVQYITVTYY